MWKWEREIADGKSQTADARCEVKSSGCAECESGETLAKVSQSSIVGHDSYRVMGDVMNAKLGVLSHQGMHTAKQLCQGDCVRESLSCEAKTQEKAVE